jgi:hypothetical protein
MRALAGIACHSRPLSWTWMRLSERLLDTQKYGCDKSSTSTSPM